MTDQTFAPRPRPLADGPRVTHRVFVRGLEVAASIGVWPEERSALQTVRIDLEMVVSLEAALGDDHGKVVCYDDVARRIEDLIGQGHINLVETLAERIAELCLADPRVVSARVRVEKPGALPKAAGVGVEIERRAGSR